MKRSWILLLLSLCAELIYAQPAQDIISSIPFRSIGPAYMTGRIADIEKDPTNPSTWYVAVASGNVWKTENNGSSWKPIFDRYGSFSTGCLAVDPVNPQVVWLGTGENQSQRSVSWGDGVYKSLDGGESWKNMGLSQSEHIGKILIDPRNTDVVYVAAQGPLWKAGGERGVYKTSDGGQSWEQVLEISENTGVADLVFDPKNPDILYAASYQRRRHVGILVAGGEESRIFKSTDGGQTWKKLSRGLPSGDLGRIAIAVSPQQSNVLYAMIAGSDDSQSGFYRSEDYGESWSKKNDYVIVDPQYYGEIFADPHQFDKVYVVDVIIRYTEDGGANFNRLNTRFKHVDNHDIVFDPKDPDYLMVGCDGGVYESWDRGDHWTYHSNLPITQFYRVGLDNDFPFYNIYGGTQDNSTLYGPSRTTSRHGITNADWKLALGGDGFQARIDPEDPNIVYCESQYAGIVRYDKRTGTRIDIQPQPAPGDEALRWHWDAPLLISPHNSKRLYFAAQKVFRSDNRGDSWTTLGGDLSRGEDRNQRMVMGKRWSPEAVWKNVFTSPYGTIVSMTESPLQEGLLIIGTDDGLIQISENAGENWRKIDKIPGVPAKAYVADVFASNHNVQHIYAVFNNHKEG
ncbi:MAG: glycosyl hydrolase, partial [Bacteroidota bacterium]